MKYSSQMLFSNTLEDLSSEDEIDELFGRLLQIEPPPTLIDTILASVARLPLPQEMQPLAWGDVEGLLIDGHDQPSS